MKRKTYGADTLHCPRCMRWRKHTRQTRNGWDIFTCTHCGAAQEYRAAK